MKPDQHKHYRVWDFFGVLPSTNKLLPKQPIKEFYLVLQVMKNERILLSDKKEYYYPTSKSLNM